MTTEPLTTIRDRWFFWLLTEELRQLPSVVAVADLYRRRLAGDEPTAKEWRNAAAGAAATYAAAWTAADAAADAAYAACTAAYAAADAAYADASDAVGGAARSASRKRCCAKLAELLGDRLPRRQQFHVALSKRVTAENLDMGTWHCGTTHCRAGHAVELCGKRARDIEKVFGTALAAGAIYIANTGELPDFYAPTSVALKDIRECAKREAASTKRAAKGGGRKEKE